MKAIVLDARNATRATRNGAFRACYSPIRLLFVLTAAAFLLFGTGVALRLWRLDTEEADGLERALAAATIGFGVWLAIDWALALTHTLARSVLFGRTAIVLLAGVVLILRARRYVVWRFHLPKIWLLCIVPIGLWLLFILWRGTITPPLSHDALSNHLPRAVIYARTHGVIDLTLISPAFRDMPVNYELLLADMLSMLRHDRYTEWLSTICYMLLVLSGGALASRWWRDNRVTILSMLALAAAPIALLQSGADKNDLLVGAFSIGALVWGGRYWKNGDFPSLLLLATSLLIAIGTKPQAGAVGVALLPLVIWRAASDVRAKRVGAGRLVAAVVFGAIAFPLLGGYTYLDQHLRAPDPVAPAGPSVLLQATIVPYGDWANLWQGPYVLVAAPFEPSAVWLHVPWDKPWFWKRYEIYMSHLGIPFALCLIGALFSVAAWRNPERRAERLAIAGAAVLALLIQLPATFRPHGVYVISLPRYAMFFAAPVIAWSMGAALLALARRTRRAFMLLVSGVLAFFAVYGLDYAVSDAFAPLDYVLLARQFPGTRFIPFDSGRATSRLDAIAGPHDKVAIDATWATWIHPIFGAQLARPVYFIPAGDGPVQIPADTDWVVVERAYDVIWGNQNMKTLADTRRLFHQNAPGPAELRVVRALSQDPNFRKVWSDPRRNQAIFKRVRKPGVARERH